MGICKQKWSLLTSISVTQFDAEEGELPEAERQIAFLRMGMDINAWLVSRSLWNAEQSQDVETLCASVLFSDNYS